MYSAETAKGALSVLTIGAGQAAGSVMELASVAMGINVIHVANA